MVRRVCLVVAVIAAGSVPGVARAASQWLPTPTTLTPAGSSINDGSYDVAMGANGDALAVWNGPSGLVASFRPAGGTFGPAEPVPLMPGGTVGLAASVALDGPVGVIAFIQSNGSNLVAARAVRNADGTYAETTQLTSPGGATSSGPRLASNHAGDIVAMWNEQSSDKTDYFATSFRPSGGEFGAPATFANTEFKDFGGAIDAAGNTLVVWDAGNEIAASSRPAGGAFSGSFPVATAAEDLHIPTVALGAGGSALVTYGRYDPTISAFGHFRGWATLRPAGSDAFGAPQDVSPNDLGAVYTGSAIDGHGDAVALLQAGSQPWAAVAPAGSTDFADPVRLSPAAHDMYAPEIAVDGAGATHIGWMGNGEDGYAARQVVRPPGGPFGDMETVPGGPAYASNFARFATDGQGNAAALWLRKEGDDVRLQASGYDSGPPQLRGLSIPSGAVGAALPFSVTPVDVWSGVASTTWAFGDGATADGAQVSHAYGSPGAFGATVTATDTLGNAASATGTAAVSAATTTTPATLALTGLSLSPRTFRAARRGASFAAATGTRVRFTLERQATVRFTAQRRTTGRRVGGRCVKRTSRNRRRAHCTRYVAVKGAATKPGKAGANSVRFSGRLRGRPLAPGRYRLVARATDAAAVRSATRRAAFRIVRR